jgi:hypothetical protein
MYDMTGLRKSYFYLTESLGNKYTEDYGIKNLLYLGRVGKVIADNLVLAQIRIFC